uniref:Uncharacterized protein n=1 Tax=Caenorhabditis japonica TaxID=281687 RepID=A0A8R1EKC8_CAEJA
MSNTTIETFDSTITTRSSTSSLSSTSSTRSSSASTPKSAAHNVLIKTISPTTITLMSIRSKAKEPVDVRRHSTRKRKEPERLEIDPRLKSYVNK